MTVPVDAHHISDMQKIWHGGYFHGDPAEPIGSREYGVLSLISFKFAILKALVEPHLKPGVRVLEIGPGRGAWTKAFDRAEEIYAVDVLSAEHNGFWKHVGEENRDRIRYVQTSDAELAECPDDYFDLLFSFGAFCHMPPETQKSYYTNMFRKARSGATGVIMFADFNKHNACLRNLRKYSTMALTWAGFIATIRFYVILSLYWLRGHSMILDVQDSNDRPGRFFHMGIESTAAFLKLIGWDVVSQDIGLSPRDPIVVFRKP